MNGESFISAFPGLRTVRDVLGRTPERRADGYAPLEREPAAGFGSALLRDLLFRVLPLGVVNINDYLADTNEEASEMKDRLGGNLQSKKG